MKLFILAVIGIIVILHILDKKPPTPTENGKKIEKEVVSEKNLISKEQSKQVEEIIEIVKDNNPLKTPKVWTYIEVPNDTKILPMYYKEKNVPIFYQKCIEKMEKNTPDLIVLTPKNIEKYIPKFPIVMNHKSEIPLRKRIDILFAHILYEYGGLCVSPGTILFNLRDILSKTNTVDLVSFGSSPRVIQSINNPKYPNTYVIGSRKFSPFISEYKRLLLISVKDNYKYEVRNTESYDIMSQLLNINEVKQYHYSSEYDGTYNSRMKLIDVSEYLGNQSINYYDPTKIKFVSVPYDELEKRPELQWFLELSREQLNKSNLEVLRLLNKVSFI